MCVFVCACVWGGGYVCVTVLGWVCVWVSGWVDMDEYGCRFRVGGCGLVGGRECCGVRVSLTLTIEACVLCVCSVHVVQSILSSVSKRLVHSHRISRR